METLSQSRLFLGLYQVSCLAEPRKQSTCHPQEPEILVGKQRTAPPSLSSRGWVAASVSRDDQVFPLMDSLKVMT